MKIKKVSNKDELDILKDKTAQFNDLTFSFSEKYLIDLKILLDEKNAYQIIAKDDNDDFVAYIASAEKNLRPGFLWIVELFVLPAYQGKGVATEMISMCIKEAKNKKLNGLITQTEFKNIPAQNLYKKMGFVEIDNPDWKDGITYRISFSKYRSKPFK